MKHLRELAKSSMMKKLQRLGAHGSLKQAHKAEHAPRKYADGGAVAGDPVGGMAAKPRLDRPSRKAGKGGKGKGTSVNVIIMPKGDAGPKPDMPMGPMAGPPPGPMPPMPPPGPGGPPMPMRKHGGRIKRDDGGRISDDSKLEAYRLRKEADKDSTEMKNFVEVQAPAGVGLGTMLGAGKGRWLAKGIGAGLTALGASNLGRANDRINAKVARDKEIDRIEKGQVKEGEEDRKRGGKVSGKLKRGGKAC